MLTRKFGNYGYPTMIRAWKRELKEDDASKISRKQNITSKKACSLAKEDIILFHSLLLLSREMV